MMAVMSEFTWVDITEGLSWLPSEPYLVPEDRCGELAATLRSMGFFVGEVDGVGITSQDDLLSEIGAVLGFPDYYGANWDALNDCAGGLASCGKARVAIVWHDSHLLLSRSVHDFVRSVVILTQIAMGVSALIDDRVEPNGQLEVFFGGAW